MFQILAPLQPYWGPLALLTTYVSTYVLTSLCRIPAEIDITCWDTDPVGDEDDDWPTSRKQEARFVEQTKIFFYKKQKKPHKETKKSHNNNNNNNLASKLLLYYLLDETVATDRSFELSIKLVWRLTLVLFFFLIVCLLFYLFVFFLFLLCRCNGWGYVCVNDFWHINVALLHFRDNEARVASVVL